MIWLVKTYITQKNVFDTNWAKGTTSTTKKNLGRKRDVGRLKNESMELSYLSVEGEMST
jgi:hypothetical protein